MRSTLLPLLLISPLWGGLCACSAPAPSNSTALPAPTDGPATLSVDQALSQAQTLKRQTVIVQGRYSAWTGSCRGGPPITRSDWMLEGTDQCLYVHGPLPQGITRAQDQSALGQPVHVQGTLETTPEGQTYLKARTTPAH